MSEAGIGVPAIQGIINPVLRDIVAAYTDMARPTTIYLSGVAVAVGPFIVRADEWKIAALGIAAGVVTGVAYFRSQDRRAEIGRAQ